MQFIENLNEQFSFVRGNNLMLIISWILMDFAGELPGTYYSDACMIPSILLSAFFVHEPKPEEREV